MKKTLLLCTVLALAGCGSEGASGTGAASTSAAPSGKPAVTATAAAPATAAATATAAPAAGAAAYRGIKAGNVAMAYMTDPKDPGQCGVITASEAEKATLDDGKIKDIIKMMKGEAATSCPTDNIVGACTAFGIAVQYYGPKYTKDSAKKDCKGTFSE